MISKLIDAILDVFLSNSDRDQADFMKRRKMLQEKNKLKDNNVYDLTDEDFDTMYGNLDNEHYSK